MKLIHTFPVTVTTGENNDTLVTRVTSGTGGITSKSGAAHAVLDSTASPSTGAYTWLGGPRSEFDGGYTVSLDVYMDLTDPAVTADTYGWDLSTDQAGPQSFPGLYFPHRFRRPRKHSGRWDNNSNFTRRNDLATINHYTVNTSGWYTFEWVFRDDGSDVRWRWT